MTEKEITMEDLEESLKNVTSRRVPPDIPTYDRFLAQVNQIKSKVYSVSRPQGHFYKSESTSISQEETAVEKKAERNSTAQQTEEQLDLMAWKMDEEKGLVVPVSSQDMCVMNLLKSVSEVRSDYRALRKELGEVQQLQRELSVRLRAQLRLVHGKFARLRQRLAAADQHMQAHQR